MKNQFQDRFAALSPEQRALLEKRLQEKGLDGKVMTKEKEGLPEDALQKLASGLVQKRSAAAASRPRRTDKGMDFSLFFFSGDGAAGGQDKYRLLMESAKYADQNGFAAVWTPERHFEEFGGLYPNPSVLSAALAAVTENIQLRAGSVVLPLHRPIRFVEEWSVVDNLSNGRVSIALASGWHPADYAVAPEQTREAYESRKERLFQAIPQVQKLWAGEPETFIGVDGKEHTVTALPRPIQKELPLWIATNGSLETYRQAAELGAGILTGIGGQTLEELEEKIAFYRAELAKNGYDPASGKVAMMLHTCLGPTDEGVKDTVRAPMRDYLKTYIKQHKTLQADFGSITEADKDVLVTYAFENYFEDSALFGSIDKCASLVETMIDIGVDEVACLIDFGIDQDAVMESLGYLTKLKDRYTREGGTR